MHTYIVRTKTGDGISVTARDEAHAIEKRLEDLAVAISRRPGKARQAFVNLPETAEHALGCACRGRAATRLDLYDED